VLPQVTTYSGANNGGIMTVYLNGVLSTTLPRQANIGSVS
jgi:hypothetical protein